jgi:hypothetical protein
VLLSLNLSRLRLNSYRKQIRENVRHIGLDGVLRPCELSVGVFAKNHYLGRALKERKTNIVKRFT